MSEFSIGVEGISEETKIEIIDLDIKYCVNEIPSLHLRLLDTFVKDDEFPLSKPEIFGLGKEITVKTSDDKITLFKGLITGVSIGAGKQEYIELEAYGDAIKLANGCMTQLFDADVSDDQLIKKAMEYAGASAGTIAPSKITHNQYFCYQQSPWRVIMSRVLENGCVFVPTPDGNDVVDLQVDKPALATIDLKASDIRSFQLGVDSSSQVKTIQAQAWSMKEQKLEAAVKGELGEYKALADVDAVLATPELTLLSNIPRLPDESKAQVTAQNNYRLLDLYQGQITLVVQTGSKMLDVKLMNELDVSGAGTAFSGKYIVTGICHSTQNQQWIMVLTLGLPLRLTLQSGYTSLPPLSLFVAKVAAFKEDEKEGLERIPIKLQTVAGETEVWARLLTPFASEEEGLFFQPNEDDEVIVGFIDGESRYPVILGSTHNPKQKPPKPYAEESPIHGVFVNDKDKKPIHLSFDKEAATFETLLGEKTTIVASEEGGVVTTADKSSITIAEDIILASGKAATVEAEAEVTLKSGKGVVVDSGKGLEVK